jgi:hypothetical protein
MHTDTLVVTAREAYRRWPFGPLGNFFKNLMEKDPEKCVTVETVATPAGYVAMAAEECKEAQP